MSRSVDAENLRSTRASRDWKANDTSRVVGTMRGLLRGRQEYGAVAFGTKAVLATPMPMSSDYRGLVVEIVKFFQTGVSPVPPDETLEIMAFMEAAELSKKRGGAPVAMTDVTGTR